MAIDASLLSPLVQKGAGYARALSEGLMLGFGGATTPPTGTAASRGANDDGSTPGGGVETEAERRMRELQVCGSCLQPSPVRCLVKQPL